jgi:hypothetical protein
VREGNRWIRVATRGLWKVFSENCEEASEWMSLAFLLSAIRRSSELDSSKLASLLLPEGAKRGGTKGYLLEATKHRRFCSK